MPNYFPPASGGGGGAVTSVATRTGDVTLAVADVSGAAPAANPTFTGTVTLPSGLVLPASVVIPTSAVATTQSASDNSTKVATTAYTDTGLALKANLAGPTFTGVVTLPTGTVATTQSASDNSTKLGTTAYIDTADALKANLASPTLTGTPTLPTGTIVTTQTNLNGGTAIASTSYVDNALNSVSLMPTGAVGATMDRAVAAFTTRTAVTAQLFMSALYLPKGVVVSNFNCMSNATASSATHCYMALFNGSRVQLAASADDTSSNAGFTASTVKTQAVATIASGASATFTTTYSGLYYVGLSAVFTGTAPTVRCISVNTDIAAVAPIMCGSSNGSQSTPNAFAFTANALSTTNNHDYIWLT